MRVAKPLPEETTSKLLRSRIEAQTLKERDLRCPLCGFKVFTVYSDIQGHLQIKCPKCKENAVLNIAYFRRIKAYADKLRKNEY